MPPRKIDPTYAFAASIAVSLTIADEEITGYKKITGLLQHSDFLFEPPWLRDIALREIYVCELLKQIKDPNSCSYQGTYIHKGLVDVSIFERYMTLREFLYEGYTVDLPQCVQDIQNGIGHLHSQGFVHCDIKPDTIFVHLKSQRFVVGDFESVHSEGASLSLKRGTTDWAPKDANTEGITRYNVD
jgi:serine/threonine protein kinase